MNRIAQSRRSFLKAVGAAAAALPFFKLLEHSATVAHADTGPLRFIGMYHPHGCSTPYWARRPGETETQFDISYPDCALSAFDNPTQFGKSFKDKILVIEGVDLKIANDTNTAGHDAAACIFTGSGADPSRDYAATNASIDQYLAVEKGLGNDTPFRSLILGVGAWINTRGWNVSYARGGAPIDKIVDPLETYNTLFARMTAPNDPAAAAAAARARKLGHSSIDYIVADIQRLNGRLAGPERDKLDQHLTAIRDIEKRLDTLPSNSCQKPGVPKKSGNSDPSLNFPQVNANNGGEPYFDRITDLQIDLLAQALACDLTRFATIFGQDPGSSPVRNSFSPPLSTNCHDDVAHRYGTDAFSQKQLAHVTNYNYAKCARLMQRLDEMGILDNSLIYMSSDMGDPSLHSKTDVPMLLAGGANGYFRMGRRVVQSPAVRPGGNFSRRQVSHNGILVSIANAFGVNITSYGTSQDPSDNNGPFPNLR